MVRGRVVNVALQQLLPLLLLLAQLSAVTRRSRLLPPPSRDGGQARADTLTSPTFRQALSDNTGGVRNNSIERK